MLTAALIIDHVNQRSKGRGFTLQALDELNAVLGDLCEDYDLALARGTFNFNFNPQLTSLFGSGPYPLPLDYLRTSGSSGARGATKPVTYLYPNPTFPSGQRLYMTPIDLGEFDLFPQLPSQSTPELWATDMGAPLSERIVSATTMQTTAGSVTATVASALSLVNGLSVAGEGIVPGTTMTIAGVTVTLSNPAQSNLTAASVFFGVPPVAYVYPAPLGPYPVQVRYQRKMPPLTDTSQIPWFPNEGYLMEELASRMAAYTGDSRAEEWHSRGLMRLRKYLGLSDDKTNRSQAVQLDGRMYGQGGLGGRNLRNTKTIGW
jgi:hypothetical protein